MGAKVLADNGSDVVGSENLSQKSQQLEELRVRIVVEPALNGDAIVNLVPVRVGRIIDEDSPREVSSQHGQVFEVVALHKQAGLAKEAVLDVLVLGVEQVEKHVGVDFLRCRKDDDFKRARNGFEKVVEVGPLPDVDVVHGPVERDGEDEVGLFNGLDCAVHERLVQVEDQRWLERRRGRRGGGGGGAGGGGGWCC